MHGIGVEHVGVADTIGVGTPAQGAARPGSHVAGTTAWTTFPGHFHDTYGMALANTLASAGTGYLALLTPRWPDLGGCPYAKGATGNVASEDVVYMLHGIGY